MRVSSSRPDPYVYDRDLGAHPSYDPEVISKTRSTPRLTPGERTFVGVFAGQSQFVNTHTGGYTIVNPTKVDNLNIADGGVYRASEPLLGCQTVPDPTKQGNMVLAVGDKLITAGVFDRAILIPVAIGGTLMDEWATKFYRNILVADRRAKAVGLTLSAIPMQIGESDGYFGTTSAAVQASFILMRSKLIAAGCTAPLFLAKSTWIGGTTSATIRGAVDALVAAGHAYAGPDTDTLDNSYRHDTTHFNASGRDAGAALWVTALDAVF